MYLRKALLSAILGTMLAATCSGLNAKDQPGVSQPDEDLKTIKGKSSGHTRKSEKGLEDSRIRAIVQPDNSSPAHLLQSYLPIILAPDCEDYPLPFRGPVESIYFGTSKYNKFWEFDDKGHLVLFRSALAAKRTEDIFTYDESNILVEHKQLESDKLRERQKIVYEKNGLKALVFDYGDDGVLSESPETVEVDQKKTYIRSYKPSIKATITHFLDSGGLVSKATLKFSNGPTGATDEYKRNNNGLKITHVNEAYAFLTEYSGFDIHQNPTVETTTRIKKEFLGQTQGTFFEEKNYQYTYH